jgi:hypothetical protein
MPKKPSSDKRIEASRQNGKLAKGRKTPEGIQRSSRNACKHGLTATQLCNNDEDTALLESLTDSYFDAYNPVGPLELDLVQDIIVARFRLQRCIALESEAIFIEVDRQQTQVDHDWPKASENTHLALAVASLVKRTRTLDHYRRYETLFRRTIDRAVKELERVQHKRLSGPPQGPPTCPPAPNTKLQNDPTDHPPSEPPPAAAYPSPNPLRPTVQQWYLSTCNMANTSPESTIRPPNQIVMISQLRKSCNSLQQNGSNLSKVNSADAYIENCRA